MTSMSFREFNADISRVLALVEAGEDVVLTRNGEAAVRLTREGVDILRNRRTRAVDLLNGLMDTGLDFRGRATYDERTAR